MITTGSAAQQSITRLAVWIGVVGLLLRAAIAPGLMLDASAAAHGEVRLVICTGGGLKVLPSLPGDDPANPEHRLDHGPCPYAASTPLAVAAETPRVAGLDFARAPMSVAAEDLAPIILMRGADARAPPRRA
jgi:hypothetical protein